MPVSLMQGSVLLAAYLVGAIPFGLVLGRLGGVDVRRAGSGNIGATNVLRQRGAVAGIATLLLDAAKGAAGVALALGVEPQGWLPFAAAVAAVLGHCYPVYLGFRGGKGVATAAGAFGLLSPMLVLLALLVFALVMGGWRLVSAASLAATVALPLLAWVLGPGDLVAASLTAAVVVLWRHKDNLRRLLAGEEERLGGAARRSS
jgi:glycerol-3-phosphate acyltransferase PlsY